MLEPARAVIPMIKLLVVVEDSVQITGLYSWGPPEIASRVEIDAVGQYLKPYLDTIVVENLGGIFRTGSWMATLNAPAPIPSMPAKNRRQTCLGRPEMRC
jgi:hypothetical protein